MEYTNNSPIGNPHRHPNLSLSFAESSIARVKGSANAAQSDRDSISGAIVDIERSIIGGHNRNDVTNGEVDFISDESLGRVPGYYYTQTDVRAGIFVDIINLPRNNGQDLMNYVSRLHEIAPEIENVDILDAQTWLDYLSNQRNNLSEEEKSVFESGLLDVNKDGVLDLIDYYAVMAVKTQGHNHRDVFKLDTYNQIHSAASLNDIKNNLTSMPRTNSTEVANYIEAMKAGYIDPSYSGASYYNTLNNGDVTALQRYIENGTVPTTASFSRAKFAFDNGLYDFNNDGVTDNKDVEILTRYVSGNNDFTDLLVTAPERRQEPTPSPTDRARIAIDTNSDNWVSVEEMVQARLEMRRAETHPQNFPDLVAKYDFNQDGSVDQADQDIAMNLLNSGQVSRVNEELERIRERQASIDRVQGALDADNNLIVTVEETVKAMLEMRLATLYPDSYPEFVQKYDLDRNGIVDIRDHGVIAAALGRGVVEGANAEITRLDRAVGALDTNQDLDLSVEEMVQARLGMATAQSHPQNFPDLVAKYDFNQDGRVDQKDQDLFSYYLSPEELVEVEARLANITRRHNNTDRAAAVIDLNSDHWVSVDELVQAFLKMQLAQSLPTMFPQYVTEFDFNQDGVVDQADRDIALGILNSGQTNSFNQEWNSIISNTSALDKARDANDQNSNGFLTAREIYDTMVEMRLAENLPAMYPDLVTKYDFDGDGKVDHKDYYLGLRLANNGMIAEINQGF
jgi:Ca2+-binding EF-hand superfamily protein